LKDEHDHQRPTSRLARQQRVADSRQLPLFDIRQFRPQPYEPTSVFGMLERFGELVISRSDFPEPAHTGPPSWCKVLLSKLVIIQRHHGWTDRDTVDRATNDLRVKACLGLGVEQEGPSQPKLSTHRSLMRQLGLSDVYERRFVELVKLLGLLEPDEPALVDSVPVTGAGQVLDAYNLIAAAIRSGLKRLAKVVSESQQQLARRLELVPFLTRSAKGRFDVDWEDGVVVKRPARAHRTHAAAGQRWTCHQRRVRRRLRLGHPDVSSWPPAATLALRDPAGKERLAVRVSLRAVSGLSGDG
jgi:hypothetical protein